MLAQERSYVHSIRDQFHRAGDRFTLFTLSEAGGRTCRVVGDKVNFSSALHSSDLVLRIPCAKGVVCLAPPCELNRRINVCGARFDPTQPIWGEVLVTVHGEPH